MSEASKLITDALLHTDGVTVLVGGKTYYVESPCIRTIARAASHLNGVEGGNTFGEVLGSMSSLEDSCKALSVFIAGDESLAEELSQASLKDVVEALKASWNLISIADFRELSVLARNVARLIAKPRP